jgi:hypothetical protein
LEAKMTSVSGSTEVPQGRRPDFIAGYDKGGK